MGSSEWQRLAADEKFLLRQSGCLSRVEAEAGYEERKHLVALCVGESAKFIESGRLDRYRIVCSGPISSLSAERRKRLERLPGPVDASFPPDGRFDLVYVGNFLHRAPDPCHALEILRRKLRPGGILLLAEAIVFTPEDSEVPTRFLRLTNPAVQAMRTKEEVLEACQKSGLQDVVPEIFAYCSSWFRAWCRKVEADQRLIRRAIDIYRSASSGFRRRFRLRIDPDNSEITTVAPRLIIQARAPRD